MTGEIMSNTISVFIIEFETQSVYTATLQIEH